MAKKITIKTNWKKLILELIVVFLGVTMGFVMNNWASNNRKEAMEIEYKKLLVEDLKANVKETVSSIKSDSIWLIKTERLLRHLDTVPSAIIDSLPTIYEGITTADILSIQKSTYESLKNSGDMNLITDVSLRTNLIRYYSATAFKVEFSQQYLYNFLNNQTSPLLIQSMDRLTGEFIEPEKHARTYLNHFITVYKGKVALIRNYYDLLGHSEYLIETLEKNLD